MRYGLIVMASIGVATLAVARPKTPEVPAGRAQAYETLVKCRSIADDAARLRCFDQAAAALQQAAERRDIVIIDREQVQQTRRSLFGIEGLRVPFFGHGDEKGEEVSQIDGVIASASQVSYGRWMVRLEDGSIWLQVDDNAIAVWPKAGQKVVVKRAALGSYMMRVNGQPGVRVKRQL
jgi:hypothetical protein